MKIRRVFAVKQAQSTFHTIPLLIKVVNIHQEMAKRQVKEQVQIVAQ